jgi:hypothetical protein
MVRRHDADLLARRLAMSRLPTPAPPRHLIVAAVIVFAASPAPADDAVVGTVRSLPVVSVSLAVGSTERETKRVVYAPPPGWYIRSHRVECAKKAGLSSFAVSTVPAGWHWLMDEKTMEAGRAKAGAVIPTAAGLVGARAEAEGAKAAAGHQANSSTHHVLVLDVIAQGAGFWRGGGAIDLTVTAEMVYVGKE